MLRLGTVWSVAGVLLRTSVVCVLLSDKLSCICHLCCYSLFSFPFLFLISFFSFVSFIFPSNIRLFIFSSRFFLPCFLFSVFTFSLPNPFFLLFSFFFPPQFSLVSSFFFHSFSSHSFFFLPFSTFILYPFFSLSHLSLSSFFSFFPHSSFQSLFFPLFLFCLFSSFTFPLFPPPFPFPIPFILRFSSYSTTKMIYEGKKSALRCVACFAGLCSRVVLCCVIPAAISRTRR